MNEGDDRGFDNWTPNEGENCDCGCCRFWRFAREIGGTRQFFHSEHCVVEFCGTAEAEAQAASVAA